MTAGLPKEERLSSKKAVSLLLKNGKWGKTSHLRFCCLSGNGLEINRVMVSVPKRNFKRAVKRNLLKRRIREAYRTQKNFLPPQGLDMLFVYAAAEVQDFAVIRDEMNEAFLKISSSRQ